jgi:hypothetical protein
MARIRAKTSNSGRNTLKSMNSFIAVLVHELQGSCKDTHRVTAGPQRHAPQGDRTREFLLSADRPMDNSGRRPSRLPLRFRATDGGSVVSRLRVLRCWLCQGTARARVLTPLGWGGRRFSRRRASGCKGIAAPDRSLPSSWNDNRFSRIPALVFGTVRARTFGRAKAESAEPRPCREI